jgi:hypothetical protein
MDLEPPQPARFQPDPTQIAAGQSTVYAYGVKGAAGETQGQLKQRSVPGAQTAVYTRDVLGLVTKA